MSFHPTGNDKEHSAEVNNEKKKTELKELTIALKDVTRRNSKKNFVVVTMTLNLKNIALKDYYVSAFLADQEGASIKGSSGKQGSNFIYNTNLDYCKLTALLLTNVACPNAQDTCFEKNQTVSFRIAVSPNQTTQLSKKPTLVVNITHKDKTLIATRRVTLKNIQAAS